MADTSGADEAWVAANVDDARRLDVRPSDRESSPAVSAAARVVVDVSDSERLTSAQITELLTMARRAGGRLVVRGGSRKNLRVLSQAGLSIEAGDARATRPTRTRAPL